MGRIKISPWLPAALCAFYRLDPVGCFWPFLTAALIHELGHILAVRLCGGEILSLRLNPMGAVMDTSPLSYRQEVLCALAGPAAGLFLLLFSRLFPWLGFWALVQSLYNLLPLYPLDGGRALRCLLQDRFPLEKALQLSRWIGIGMGIVLLLLSFRLGPWTGLLAGIALARAAAESMQI